MKILSIGRNETCDIVLEDNTISRRHATLRIKATGKMEIIDLSQNGTFVNNMRIKPNVPVPVTRKDIITFSQTEQLDWKQVPNPLKLYMIIGIALVIAAVALIFILPSGGKNKLKVDNPEDNRDTTKTHNVPMTPKSGNEIEEPFDKDREIPRLRQDENKTKKKEKKPNIDGAKEKEEKQTKEETTQTPAADNPVSVETPTEKKDTLLIIL